MHAQRPRNITLTGSKPCSAHADRVCTVADVCRRRFVHHNRVEGTKHEISGAIKEAAGKVTGNKSREMAGAMEKQAGKAQKAAGKAADDARKHHS
jgi:uncharacterized protein YjbJ (UPF0337 family)